MNKGINVVYFTEQITEQTILLGNGNDLGIRLFNE